MDLNYLRAFYEVAKVGRFSEAAKRLHISQSALSRSVALLEEAENVSLFTRSKAGVSLTPTGHEIFLRCEQLFRTEREIENLCRGTRETCEGIFRFAASEHIVNDLLVRPLEEFRAQYPRVIPSISSGTPDEIVNSLLTTENEFAFLFSKIETPQVTYTRLQPETMALVCAPKLWKKYSGKAGSPLRAIMREKGYLCSIGSLANARSSRVIRELFGEAPEIGLETNSQEAQKRFCLAGEGVAYLARFFVEKEILSGSLYEIPVDHPHEFHMWLARRRGRLLSLTARNFLQRFGVKDEG